MRVIIPTLPDPTDIVLQGAIIGDYVIDTPYIPVDSMLNPVLQGAVIGEYKMQGFPVPRAMIGQVEEEGVPAQTGPKVFSGGELVMLDIGAGKPQMVFVDKTQAWLMSCVQTDLTGAMTDRPDGTHGAEEAVWREHFVAGIAWFEEKPSMQIPRKAIQNSRGMNNWTSSKVSPNFCFRVPDRFDDSTELWYVVVTVKDETATVVQGATVYLMQPSLYGVGPSAPINQIGITDAGGQCVFPVSYFWIQQMMAWKEGSPNKWGVSAYTTQGNNTITMYIKDPSTAIPVAGAGFPVVGNSGLVRTK